VGFLKDKKIFNRREFLKWAGSGLAFSALQPFRMFGQSGFPEGNDLFWVKDIPHDPFVSKLGLNAHAGLDCLLHLMGGKGLKFYRSLIPSGLSGPTGLIGPADVVLLKVNAQWKYRGCTNVDLVRGLIQRILDHPDGFVGEVVVFENGQGRGSFYCDQKIGSSKSIYPDNGVHANAENERHHFMYLVSEIFDDPRVSAYLLDPIRKTFIGDSDHVTDGYRIFQDVSYPCFTTASGRRIELRQGVWNGESYDDNLKLINIPVLKHHDTYGSEITASLKHFYGILSMEDGHRKFRHYTGLGESCGKMVASIKMPVLNILDAIWVSHSSLKGYPEETTFRANQLLASQDPVALDYWAAKYILYPIDWNERHHPDFSGIDRWLCNARDVINQKGGLYRPEKGVFIEKTTSNEWEMNVFEQSTPQFVQGRVEEIIERDWLKRIKRIK
jgi:uncharacterized protein (DUF362 family)